MIIVFVLTTVCAEMQVCLDHEMPQAEEMCMLMFGIGTVSKHDPIFVWQLRMFVPGRALM